MTAIIYPFHTSFKEWASGIQRNLTSLSFPLEAPNEDKWWHWAQEVVRLNPSIQIPLPTKEVYPKVKDWYNWALFFVNNINS